MLVPSPRVPFTLLPQHSTRPSPKAAQEYENMLSQSRAPVRLGSCVATDMNGPLAPKFWVASPQQSTRPSASRTHPSSAVGLRPLIASQLAGAQAPLLQTPDMQSP